MKSIRNSSFFICIGFFITIFITGCNLPIGNIKPTAIPQLPIPSAKPPDNPIVLQPTVLPVQPTLLQLITETPVKPTAVQVTTQLPTDKPSQPTDVPGAIRINYQKGATSAVVEGDIDSGQTIYYLLGASKTQPLIINLSSAKNDVTFAVYGKNDGKVYLDAASKVSSWQMMLAETQDYIIKIIPGSNLEHFSLNVSTPARINFDPGAITAIRNGTTAGGYTIAYVLRANANQLMELDLKAPANDAVLSVYGFQDGQPYLRYVAESTSFQLTLPATQDYIIQIVPYAGALADYSLQVTIK